MDKTFEIFIQLKGEWSLERIITPGGTMRGHAFFEPFSKHEYHYQEKGIMTLDHGEVIHDVTRSYIYRVESNAIHVYYADGPDKGALFHSLNFVNGTEAQAKHLCGEDLYRSHYTFDLPDRFAVTHEVKGPKKDYMSKTLFTRL